MNLRQARKTNRKTQLELAKATGLSRAEISNIERGKVSPRAKTRRKIEKALRLRVNWLSTRGRGTVIPNEMTSWEAVEDTFRNALINIKGLQRQEREDFLELAKQYIQEFERELHQERPPPAGVPEKSDVQRSDRRRKS